MKRITLTVLLFLFPGLFFARGQEFSISTNFADYARMGTINLDASWGPSRHWSVEAGAKYNPFSFGSGEGEYFSKQRLVKAGARWWPWHIYSGWWAGAGLRFQEYSEVSRGNPKANEGNRFGSSFGGGYSKMIGSHLNLDFGLSLWMGYSTYTTYACQRCGRIVGSGNQFFILPADIVVALSYIF